MDRPIPFLAGAGEISSFLKPSELAAWLSIFRFVYRLNRIFMFMGFDPSVPDSRPRELGLKNTEQAGFPDLQPGVGLSTSSE